MAIGSNGPLSISTICVEKSISSTNASLATLSTTNINTASLSKPNGNAPYNISEFYSYNHTATAPSLTITGYNSGYIYFIVSGTGYSPSVLTLKYSTTSANGPWTSGTAGSTSPRNVSIPSVTTWYQLQDTNTPSILSNVYQYTISDTTPPPAPILTGTFNNTQRALTLSWSAVSDPSGPVSYKVYSSNVQRTVVSSGTSITLYGAWISTGYNSWTVRSVDAAGNTSANSNAYIFTAS
ncbi:hypothetical protein [Flavobacterium olei]|uniref:hypothetical protein n=1 Tax=Flavobacterium olei TaxID=1886782 RepID=UPI00321901AA